MPPLSTRGRDAGLISRQVPVEADPDQVQGSLFSVPYRKTTGQRDYGKQRSATGEEQSIEQKEGRKVSRM
jgi:hypothetical protein